MNTPFGMLAPIKVTPGPQQREGDFARSGTGGYSLVASVFRKHNWVKGRLHLQMFHKEVENALASYVNESERLDALRRSATAALQSVELVKTLYLSGLVDFQNLLDQEESLFEEQDKLASSEGRVTQNLIQVYRTLGGGW